MLSPLRYPGSKRRLVQYLQSTLDLNNLSPRLFVEPFAGGASVALQLLHDGTVQSIGLSDIDSLVASFWSCVFFDTEWLVAAVQEVEVSLAKWKELRHAKAQSKRDQALKCLFLNRTSFSGILAPSAGPIGGWKQTSEYDIACRFPRARLSKRITEAGNLRDRVAFVRACDWRVCLEELDQYESLCERRFVYLDPPFYRKAEKLYTYYFQEPDHQALYQFLKTMKEPWLLSYDASESIERLYSSNGIKPARVEMLYSAAEPAGQVASQELIITSLPYLPEQTRLWRTGK